MLQVRVLKIAGGKIQLTMKTEQERKQESDLSESGVGAGSTRKARTSLEAALAKVGFKHTPDTETEVQTPTLNSATSGWDSSKLALLLSCVCGLGCHQFIPYTGHYILHLFMVTRRIVCGRSCQGPSCQGPMFV